MASTSRIGPPAKKRKLNTDIMSPISRVMHSSNHFEVLELPPPKLDDLDRVVWTAQRSDVKQQYYKISRQVHPDRHVADEKQSKRAADSFDIVQAAFQTLHDSAKREEYLTEFGEKLKYKASKSKYDTPPRSERRTITRWTRYFHPPSVAEARRTYITAQSLSEHGHYVGLNELNGLYLYNQNPPSFLCERLNLDLNPFFLIFAKGNMETICLHIPFCKIIHFLLIVFYFML